MKKRRFKHLSWTDRLKIETMLKEAVLSAAEELSD